jgi:hypothetical protein
MHYTRHSRFVEFLEHRRLLAWSPAAQLVNQDDAASNYASVAGAGVTVAVIDTGIDYSLPQLGGGFGAGWKVVGGYDFYAGDADPMDEDGHGTQVASIVAAAPYTVNGITYQGIAPDANLVALRVGSADSITTTNIERALQWVIAHNEELAIRVVNLSVGSGNYTDPEISARTSDEFQRLRELGIFVVAASGNSNDHRSGPIGQDGVSYPAADPDVFAVGSVSSGDVISSWTQRGDELDLLAPGEDIVTLDANGGYETVDGTSFAAPFVAGAAALVRSLDPAARAGDIGSILMSSGQNNRDGDIESGNTTTLQFARLDLAAALALAGDRGGRYASLNFGGHFDTALDTQGILHAAYYADGKLLYTVRNTSGMWSEVSVIDADGDVGAWPSIAVDSTGKVGIAYFDLSNTAVKYASFGGTSWPTLTLESKKHVGSSPSLGFDIDGNAYVAYHKRSGGYLRLARLDRDANTWTRQSIDGGGGTDVGGHLDLDVDEVTLRSTSGFTVYHTAVAIAYLDKTNGNLKYARLDVDDAAAEWFVSVVDDTSGVAHIDLDLHDGPLGSSQAQIAYQDTSTADVRYAYRNTNWFVETVAGAGQAGKTVQMYFSESDDPIVVYYDLGEKALYGSLRDVRGLWARNRLSTSAGPMSIALNERTDESVLTWLNRPRTDVFSRVLI